MFKEAGYRSFSLESILKEICVRYQRYMEYKEDFPHEMGLLLGYPVEDVKGFMKHKGENSLCIGIISEKKLIHKRRKFEC